MRPPRNDAPAKTPQAQSKDHIESSPMDDLNVALMKVLVPVATFFGWAVDQLPSIAAAVSIAWMGYQWYHSEPMKQRRQRRRAKGKRT